MDMPIIELKGVVKSFGPVEVLKGVNLTAYPGKITALVGDNGAGKSTLIKGLAGVQPYDGGEVLFNGEPVNLHSPRDAGAVVADEGRDLSGVRREVHALQYFDRAEALHNPLQLDDRHVHAGSFL